MEAIFPQEAEAELARHAEDGGESVLGTSPAGFAALSMMPGDVQAFVRRPRDMQTLLGIVSGRPSDPQGCLAFYTIRGGRRFAALCGRFTQAQEQFFDECARSGLEVCDGGRGLRLLHPADRAAERLRRSASGRFRCILDVPGRTFWRAGSEPRWIQPVFGPGDGTGLYPIFNMAGTAAYALIRACGAKPREAAPENASAAVLQEAWNLLEEWSASTESLVRSGSVPFRLPQPRPRSSAAGLVGMAAKRIFRAAAGWEPVPAGSTLRSVLAGMLRGCPAALEGGFGADRGDGPGPAGERTMLCLPEDDPVLEGILQREGLVLPQREPDAAFEPLVPAERRAGAKPAAPGRSAGSIAAGLAMDEERRTAMVDDVVCGRLSAMQASAVYGVSLNTVYRWLRRSGRWERRAGRDASGADGTEDE